MKKLSLKQFVVSMVMLAVGVVPGLAHATDPTLPDIGFDPATYSAPMGDKLGVITAFGIGATVLVLLGWKLVAFLRRAR